MVLINKDGGFGIEKTGNRMPFFKRTVQKYNSAEEQRPDFYFKLVLLGDKGTGKTTVSNAFSSKASKSSYLRRPSYEHFRFLEFSDFIIQVSQYKVLTRVFDTAGRSKFRQLLIQTPRTGYFCYSL